ncbi:hypothetical protein SteCoe_3363 [Stentor coeruleus]|uniref:Uncharacterized protein n=1 Tax=Stentor coeruleus TaxID=5963 RepID=A0A1R2CXD4_9CILI|nr:hypothetical protein SteCoe_3363 [Stentor coeruleus]
MEALLIISSVPSLIEPNQMLSDRIRKVQRLADLLLKTKLKDRTLNQIILFFECIRAAACLKEKKIDDKELATALPSASEYMKSIAGIFRPFLYLLAMIIWGRNSKHALAVCIIMDMLSDVRVFDTYFFRYPIFEKLSIKLIPGFLKSTVRNYQSYITYIL